MMGSLPVLGKLASVKTVVRQRKLNRGRRKPFLVVAALAAVLRGKPGRNAGDNDDTTRQLSGRLVSP